MLKDLISQKLYLRNKGDFNFCKLILAQNTSIWNNSIFHSQLPLIVPSMLLSRLRMKVCHIQVGARSTVWSLCSVAHYLGLFHSWEVTGQVNYGWLQCWPIAMVMQQYDSLKYFGGRPSLVQEINKRPFLKSATTFWFLWKGLLITILKST